MKNTKRIEESATTALKSALLKCPILDAYIDSNDKTPSWDGTVFVYNSENQKKENIKGRVPIQVKGTEKVFVSDVATFSCSTVDLRNYYHDGGCVFFLISVVPATGEHKIFYASLLVVDLDKILKSAKAQKSYSIRLKLFPENDPKEMAHIFLSFASNAHKQSSFIGKDLLSIEELERRGTKIESLTFNASGIGLKEEELASGNAFVKKQSATYDSGKRIHASSSVKYDLIGKLVEETGLTRKAVVAILTGIEKVTFNQFKDNPEEFIIRAAALINDEKATAIIQHITYNVLDERYTTDIFTEPTIKGKLDVNARKAIRSLFDHIVYDSTNERDFSSELDANSDIAVYVKLPDSFYISTPVGHYNPDWAIAFYEGTVKHIYFVAETKGSMRSMQLRPIEKFKIHCAREHFKAISDNNVVYDVVDSYQTLLEKVMR